MSRMKITSQSLIVSLIVHGLIILIAGVYLVTHTKPFQDLIDATILKTPEPPKPKVRKPMIKPVTKPIVPTQSTITVKQIQPQPRAVTSVRFRTDSMTTENVIEFSNRPLKLEARPQLQLPRSVDANPPIPQIVTDVNLSPSDAPGAVVFAVSMLNSGGGGIPAQRGIAGTSPNVGLMGMSQPTTLQSFLDSTAAVPMALDALVGEMRLGNQLMTPIGPSELGARIYTDPQSGLPTGYFHLCYVRFRQRIVTHSHAREDPTTLLHLVTWMSANTRIEGRLAGRTVYLDDPGVMDSPMLYLNAEGLARLIQGERRNLRRYLAERGGFIFVQHNHNQGPFSQRTFAHSMRWHFRAILHDIDAQVREVQPIPPDHPIWHQPFPLGGQPGVVIGGGHSPITFPMVGFEINGRLAVVISYNDYDNGWKLPGSRSPGSDPIYVPSSLRMGANFIFYAATHGKISNYKRYVPPNRWQEKNIPFPKRAPQAATISATGSER